LPQPGWSADDLRRIVDAFLALPCMRDRAVRDLIVNGLTDSSGWSLNIQRHNADRADMLSIVMACTGHPGALREIGSFVEFFESGNPTLDMLRDLVERLDPETLLDGDERAQLSGLLADLSCPYPEALYWNAVGPLGPPPTTSRRDLVGFAQDLEDAAAVDGVPPLLTFVELVAGQNPTRATELRAWVDGYAAVREIDANRIGRLRTTAAERAGDPPAQSHLVVRLEPFGPNQQQYLLSAWHQHGTESVQLRDGAEPRDIEDVQLEIDRLLTREAQVIRDRAAQLVVEVILPRQLIDRDLDQWPLAPVKFERPLGTQHPLVIRCLERHREPSIHRQWRQKWERFKAHCEDPDVLDVAIRWIKWPGLVDPQRLLIQLMNDEAVVCVILAFPPPPGRSLGYDEFAAAVHAGVPLLAWCRDERDAAEFEKEIRLLIGGQGLARLPELVHSHRQRAHTDKAPDHLGRHLTLLWDDADRFPEDHRLASPEMRAL
jgi:vWA-MoxR associated protein C-terminal domain/Effector-associated domain 2/vWA-MoxR associated protein middle region 0